MRNNVLNFKFDYSSTQSNIKDIIIYHKINSAQRKLAMLRRSQRK